MPCKRNKFLLSEGVFSSTNHHQSLNSKQLRIAYTTERPATYSPRLTCSLIMIRMNKRLEIKENK